MSVDSLNRPPTLLTIASSFNSSSMLSPFELVANDGRQLLHGRIQVGIDNLGIIFPGTTQLAPAGCQAALDSLLSLGPPVPQPLFISFPGTGPQEDRNLV